MLRTVARVPSLYFALEIQTRRNARPIFLPRLAQRAGDGLAQYETKVKVENQYGVVRDAIPRWQSGM